MWFSPEYNEKYLKSYVIYILPHRECSFSMGEGMTNS